MRSLIVASTLLANILLVSNLSHAQADAQPPLIFTGEISSNSRQAVSAPRASSWQIQIQWMAEEGSIVQQGEPIVVFNGSSEQTQLEQLEERLETLELQFEQTQMRLDQTVTEAEGRFNVAQMRVNKAKIPVAIPSDTISAYQRGQEELALERALMEQAKAREALVEARQQRQAGLSKTQIDIREIQNDIQYYSNLLTKLNVKAQHTGSVNYALHPWWGSKIVPGMNVQQSWNVLNLQASTDFVVEAYVHEIDATRITDGLPVSIVFDAYPSQQYDGIITQLGSQAEKKPQLSNASYFPVQIELIEQPTFDLLTGMSVRISPDELPHLSRQDLAPELARLSLNAEVKSLQEVTLGPPSIRRMWNYKIQFLARDNQPVKAGDKIIQFDAQDLKQRLVGRQAELDAAIKELENRILEDTAREKDLELALAEAQMNEEKARRKAEIVDASRSEVERLTQQADWDISKALSAQAQQRLDEHKQRRILNKQVQEARIANRTSRVNEIKQNIASLTVTSPIDGIAIIGKNNDGDKHAVGDTVYMGNTLVTVPAVDRLAIKMEVDEADTQKVFVGQPVEIVLSAYPERIFQGNISSKAKAFRNKSINNLRNVLDVWVEFDDDDKSLFRPGMQASVTVIMDAEQDRQRIALTAGQQGQ